MTGSKTKQKLAETSKSRKDAPRSVARGRKSTPVASSSCKFINCNGKVNGGKWCSNHYRNHRDMQTTLSNIEDAFLPDDRFIVQLLESNVGCVAEVISHLPQAQVVGALKYLASRIHFSLAQTHGCFQKVNLTVSTSGESAKKTGQFRFFVGSGDSEKPSDDSCSDNRREDDNDQHEDEPDNSRQERRPDYSADINWRLLAAISRLGKANPPKKTNNRRRDNDNDDNDDCDDEYVDAEYVNEGREDSSDYDEPDFDNDNDDLDLAGGECLAVSDDGRRPLRKIKPPPKVSKEEAIARKTRTILRETLKLQSSGHGITGKKRKDLDGRKGSQPAKRSKLSNKKMTRDFQRQDAMDTFRGLSKRASSPVSIPAIGLPSSPSKNTGVSLAAEESLPDNTLTGKKPNLLFKVAPFVASSKNPPDLPQKLVTKGKKNAITDDNSSNAKKNQLNLGRLQKKPSSNNTTNKKLKDTNTNTGRNKEKSKPPKKHIATETTAKRDIPDSDTGAIRIPTFPAINRAPLENVPESDGDDHGEMDDGDSQDVAEDLLPADPASGNMSSSTDGQRSETDDPEQMNEHKKNESSHEEYLDSPGPSQQVQNSVADNDEPAPESVKTQSARKQTQEDNERKLKPATMEDLFSADSNDIGTPVDGIVNHVTVTITSDNPLPERPKRKMNQAPVKDVPPSPAVILTGGKVVQV